MTPLSYHDCSVSGPSSQQCHGIPLKGSCLFSSILIITKTFRGSRLLKYLININSYDFQSQNTSQNFHMAWHFILCSIGYIDVPNKGIEQACSWTSCDKHISPFSNNCTLAFSNVLLVLALNFMVHRPSYCKCSLAWCQVRTFLFI